MGTKNVIKLIIAIIIIIAISTGIIIFSKQSLEITRFQDLRTNMLLIQGKAKTYTENVSVETANLDEEKQEDNTKIEEVKEQKLKGTALASCDEKIKSAAQKAGIRDRGHRPWRAQEPHYQAPSAAQRRRLPGDNHMPADTERDIPGIVPVLPRTRRFRAYGEPWLPVLGRARNDHSVPA